MVQTSKDGIRYEARKKDILRTISILFITGVIVGIGFMLL